MLEPVSDEHANLVVLGRSQGKFASARAWADEHGYPTIKGGSMPTHEELSQGFQPQGILVSTDEDATSDATSRAGRIAGAIVGLTLTVASCVLIGALTWRLFAWIVGY